MFFLAFLAFVEGSIASFYEIMVAHIAGIFFGDSLRVWAISIFLSLFFLAIGYFFGNKLTNNKTDKFTTLYLFLSLCFISFWGSYYHSIARFILINTSEFDLWLSLWLFLFISLAPTMIICGSFSPILIKKIRSLISENESKSTGIIFGFSNLGGVAISLIIFVFLIELIAIKRSFFVLNILIALTLLYFLFKKEVSFKIFLFAFIVFLSNILLFKGYSRIPSNIQIPYVSEGVKGQIKIIDDIKNQTRTLHVNNSAQSQIHFSGRSLWPYVYQLTTYASSKPKDANILLAGMGGGCLVYEFSVLGYHTDVVDIDKRMNDVTRQFFVLPDTSSYKFFNDDFRYYVSLVQKKYDVVIIDLSQGETMPSHVFTKESFTNIKKILKVDGQLLVHFVCDIAENKMSLNSVYKTLIDAGFDVKLMNTNPNFSEPSGYIFSCFNENKFQLSKETKFRIDSLIPQRLNIPVNNELMFLSIKNESKSEILSDDLLQLENWQQKTADKLRRRVIKNTILPVTNTGYPLYY